MHSKVPACIKTSTLTAYIKGMTLCHSVLALSLHSNSSYMCQSVSPAVLDDLNEKKEKYHNIMLAIFHAKGVTACTIHYLESCNTQPL